MWADWWGFKMEAYDGIRENIPFVHEAGACAIVHSDDDVGIQRLNQEAAKALADGRRAGLDIAAEAWTWMSHNPAKALGIDEETGTLEPGKRADVVIWNGDPLSVYSRAGEGLYRRRADVRHGDAAAAGQRLRTWPARRRRPEMKRAAFRRRVRGADLLAGGGGNRRHRQWQGRDRRQSGADRKRYGHHP